MQTIQHGSAMNVSTTNKPGVNRLTTESTKTNIKKLKLYLKRDDQKNSR
jgi:hypothetical protein